MARSRALLRDLLGPVILRPAFEGLAAELRGNVEGLLSLEKARVTSNSGSGGAIQNEFSDPWHVPRPLKVRLRLTQNRTIGASSSIRPAP